jgi:hypothetical protein
LYWLQDDVEEDPADEQAGLAVQPALIAGTSSYAERARYIPMRLDHDERRLLRLLEASLNVGTHRRQLGWMYPGVLGTHDTACKLQVELHDMPSWNHVGAASTAGLQGMFVECHGIWEAPYSDHDA